MPDTDEVTVGVSERRVLDSESDALRDTLKVAVDDIEVDEVGVPDVVEVSVSDDVVERE